MCYPLSVLWCLGGVEADGVVCLHLGIQRSWLIVVLIILDVSLMVILWCVYVMLTADLKYFLKRRLILSDGR